GLPGVRRGGRAAGGADALRVRRRPRAIPGGDGPPRRVGRAGGGGGAAGRHGPDRRRGVRVPALRVGVMGGTFDPVHLGHVAMAEAAAACAGLDRVLIVPAAVPPHRPAAGASAADRLAMCRLAAAGHPALEVSDIELRREGLSYTVDTLRELAAERSGD